MTFMAVSCCWRLLKALKKNTQSKISSFCALGPKKAVKKYKETFVQISASSLFLLLAGQEASCLSLESDDDDGQFEISLLLQLSQNSRPEEHLTLTDAIQVRIQIQVLHLEEERRRQEGRTEEEWNRTPSSYYFIIVTSSSGSPSDSTPASRPWSPSGWRWQPESRICKQEQHSVKHQNDQ